MTALADAFEALAAPRGVLEPRVRAFVQLAVDAATTHLYEPGIREHLQAAVAAGATREEIEEVLQITSVLGIHACAVAAPILMEELGGDETPLSPRQEEVKADFVARRRTWGPTWEAMLRLDPEFLAAYTEFSCVPWEPGVLEPKVKEFIYIAIDSSATHMFEPGIRQHVRAALEHGATGEEIMEVLALTSLIGMQSMAVASPLLAEALG
jgi:alkylhydroperoxidase/carboxymuconolactone decarboxylase family protein YurZ